MVQHLQHIAKMSTAAKLLSSFLAERVLKVALMLYSVASVCRRLSSVCDVCIVVKRCVLEQMLLSTAYRKPYTRNRLVPKLMILTFVWRSNQGHVNHCVPYNVHYLENG